MTQMNLKCNYILKKNLDINSKNSYGYDKNKY